MITYLEDFQLRMLPSAQVISTINNTPSTDSCRQWNVGVVDVRKTTENSILWIHSQRESLGSPSKTAWKPADLHINTSWEVQ